MTSKIAMSLGMSLGLRYHQQGTALLERLDKCRRPQRASHSIYSREFSVVFHRVQHAGDEDWKGGYAGPKLRGALQKIGKFTLEIIKRSDSVKGFETLLRRWVVEHTFAWLGRCRRLAKDFERTIASAEAWVFIVNIRLLTRRLART